MCGFKSPYMTLTWCRRGELNPHELGSYGPQPYASASSATPTQFLYGAEGGSRTPTGVHPLRPERSASTSSTTSALLGVCKYIIPMTFAPVKPFRATAAA